MLFGMKIIGSSVLGIWKHRFIGCKLEDLSRSKLQFNRIAPVIKVSHVLLIE